MIETQSQVDRILQQGISLDEAIDRLAVEHQEVSDFLSPLKNWEPVVNKDNQFAMRNLEDGQDYVPTDHCLDCMTRVQQSSMSSWALKALRSPYTHVTKRDKNGEPVTLWSRDGRDANVLRDYVNIHMFQSDRVDQDKTRLWRTWADGTLRAVLSNQYARVDNRWYLQVLRSILPDDASVIRSGGNADTLYMDIFLGDTVDTNDGGLGSMVHIGNSEIGERRVVLTPSILRMICTNGLIGWSKLGEEIQTVHRRKDGKIDLDILQKKIVEVYQTVMPSFETGVEQMLGLKAYGVGDVPIPHVFAQMAIDYHFSKKQVKGIWSEWGTEMSILGANDAQTAYGLQNAVTRFGQKLDGKSTFEFDKIGGEMTRHSESSWTKFLGRARNLTDKEVERRTGSLIIGS